MALEVPVDFEFDITIYGVDSRGNPEPATFASTPQVTLSDGTLAAVALNDAGNVITVRPSGPLGPCTLHVTAEGGEGVVPLDADYDFVATVGAEKGFTLVASAPRPQA